MDKRKYITYKVKVLSCISDCGYKTYAFQDLDFKGFGGGKKYYTATLLPNWNIPNINIGDIGYIQIIIIKAGEEWYNKYEDKYVKFKYDGIYINKFIPHKTLDEDVLIL